MAKKDDNTGRDKPISMKTYAIIAGVLIILAVLSNLFTSLTVNPSKCISVFQSNYNCVEQLAYATSNSLMCSSLPSNYADICYSAIAENTSNAALCAKVNSTSTAARCYYYIASATNNINLCSTLTGSMKLDCVDQIAISANLAADCLQLANGSGRASCIGGVYINKAVSTLNQTYCNNIYSNNDTNVTLNALRILDLTNNTNYINMTQNLGYLTFSNISIGTKDTCYMALAYSTLSSKYCSYVSPALNSTCAYVSRHYNSVKSNATSGTNYTALMNQCMQQSSQAVCNSTINYLIASSAKNISTCKTLSGNFAYQCYYTLAQTHNSSSYCSYITNKTINTDCIVAINSGYYRNFTNNNGP